MINFIRGWRHNRAAYKQFLKANAAHRYAIKPLLSLCLGDHTKEECVLAAFSNPRVQHEFTGLLAWLLIHRIKRASMSSTPKSLESVVDEYVNRYYSYWDKQ